jgi:hypothetical protein
MTGIAFPVCRCFGNDPTKLDRIGLVPHRRDEDAGGEREEGWCHRDRPLRNEAYPGRETNRVLFTGRV